LLLGIGARSLSAKEPFNIIGHADQPGAGPFKQVIQYLHQVRRFISKPEIILGGPDLWKSLSEQYQYGSNNNHFYADHRQRHPPGIRLCYADLVDQHIGQYDNGDIYEGIGYLQRGRQQLRFLEQVGNSFPAGILLCFQQVDIAIGKRKKSNLGAGYKKRKDQ